MGEPPPEYIELILCRDVYHCTPSQLHEEDFKTVAAHLALLDEEAQVREAREHHTTPASVSTPRAGKRR